MARPSLRFAFGQDFLPLAEKEVTERHGQGLDMPIHLESACEVASTMYKTSFSRVEEIWAV